MERFSSLFLPRRGAGFTRDGLRNDVLYRNFRFREVSISVSKQTLAAVSVTDDFVQQLLQRGLICEGEKAAYEKAALAALSHIDRLDGLSAELLYRHIHQVRKTVLGAEVIERLQALLAREAADFSADGIDQRDQKQQLLDRTGPALFALTQAELFPLMQADLQAAARRGRPLWVLCGEPGDGLLSQRLLERLLEDMEGICFLQTLTQPIPERASLFFYGEEGLVACRGLQVDAVVHAVPRGFCAQAVTGLWSGEGCVVYIPGGFDITPFVPVKSKTRLTFGHLARLCREQGAQVYEMPVETLYRQAPAHFANIYGGVTCLPAVPEAAESLQDFDRKLDESMTDYLGGFENVSYISTYFDENLQRQPICYDDAQKQPGILVQAARIRRAAGARVLQCEKGVTPRAMFRAMGLPGTALVSNFLFFMTPKLGVLYNQLRADRPYEQADAASGHLDYMLAFRDGKRVETFPLFGKTVIAMQEDGSFLFSNFFLGGGTVDISGVSYRWERADVNGEGKLRLYTPAYSAKDPTADRDSYRCLVGAGRVNVVMLRDRVTCVRRGDVVLPSVGVVLSLTEEAAKPLLQKRKALENGYYDVSGLELTVRLDGPGDVAPEQWEKVRWAYGGGLTLIRQGEGLCDGGHMDAWFAAEGWTSPLSRQTQESTLHCLMKHPRTAIGCGKNGDLLVLVYSGRTWRSTGADYREMIAIARQLFPDVHMLMNADGGGSAVLGLTHQGEFMELSCPSTSTGSCAGQVRPIHTVFYIPAGERKEK